MDVRFLTKEKEIIEAKKLAYEVLVKELNWEIRSDNPSGLHIKDSPEGKMLWDDYDAVATWLGVFHDNILVGCMRFCRRLKGKFELECYHELLPFIKKDKLAKEVTRLAIRKDYRKSTVVVMLFKKLYQYLLDNNGAYCFGTGFYPNPGKLYVDKFGFEKHQTPFRYHREDTQEVYLYYINSYDRYKLIDIIAKFKKILNYKLN